MSDYQIIDCHVHVTCPYMIDDFLCVMDRAGFSRAAVLSVPFAGVGTFNAAALAAKASAPDRLYAFCSIDYRNMNAPDFAQRTVDSLENCLAAGADGFKMLLGKPGLPMVHFPLTHHRMRPIYQWFAAKEVPVYLHVGDPPYFWDKTQLHDLATDTTLAGCYADDNVYPTRADLTRQVTELIHGYPDVRFIFAHLAMSTDNLSWFSSILERSPAIMTDISSVYTLGAIAHRADEARELLETYADRVCFGTDAGVTSVSEGDQWKEFIVTYTNVYREFLETDNLVELESFSRPLNGIKLSQSTVKKIYYDNYARLVGVPKPMKDAAAFNSILDEAIETMNSLETAPENSFAFRDIVRASIASRKAAYRNSGTASLDNWVFNELKIPEELKVRSTDMFERLKR